MDECRKKACPPDKERLWEHIRRTLKRSRRRELVRKWAIAAAVMVPLAVGGWFYGFHSDEFVPVPEMGDKRHQVSLTLNDGGLFRCNNGVKIRLFMKTGRGFL